MSPKEKSNDLLNKMNNQLIEQDDWDNLLHYAKRDLKRKCLIVVDEMLSLGSMVGNDLSDTFYIYWQEVKNELLKL